MRSIVIDDLSLTWNLQVFLVVSSVSTKWSGGGWHNASHLLYFESAESPPVYPQTPGFSTSVGIAVKLSWPDFEPPVFAVLLWFPYTEAAFASRAGGLPSLISRWCL